MRWDFLSGSPGSHKGLDLECVHVFIGTVAEMSSYVVRKPVPYT